MHPTMMKLERLLLEFRGFARIRHICVAFVSRMPEAKPMSQEEFCHVCQSLVPVVAQIAGKALGAAAGAVLAVNARTLPGKLIAAVAPVVAGHFVDKAATVVCGKCGTPIQRSA